MNKILLWGLLSFATLTFSQQNTPPLSPTKKSNFWEKVRFGGGVGLDFNNRGNSFSINPSAVYEFNTMFSAGISIGYQYSDINKTYTNTYSVGALTLYNPFNELQISTEFEQLFINQKYNGNKFNRNVPALYVGAAYKLGNNFSAGIRYDLLYDKEKSPYSSAFSPIVRIFF